MPYMLLMVEPTGQRRTRTEAEGREVYGRMVRFSEDLRDCGQLLAVESLGSYALQASIAACHARAAQAANTDWPRIAALYEALAQAAPSPVVELNRAVAVAMAYGPEAGLTIIDTLRTDKALQSYRWLPGVRGDLLARLGRNAEAKAEFGWFEIYVNEMRPHYRGMRRGLCSVIASQGLSFSPRAGARCSCRRAWPGTWPRRPGA